MWLASAEACLLAVNGSDEKSYRRAADLFKAQRILSMHGYEYFKMFIDGSPHAAEIVKTLNAIPCKGDAQCNLYCYYYSEGGCKNGTNKWMD